MTKSISLLDSLIYGYSAAFTSFCTSDGLNILVARVKDETEFALQIVKDHGASPESDPSSKGRSYAKLLLPGLSLSFPRVGDPAN